MYGFVLSKDKTDLWKDHKQQIMEFIFISYRLIVKATAVFVMQQLGLLTKLKISAF